MQQEAQQKQIEENLRIKSMELEQQDMLNQRDNETKILVATIQANSKQMQQQETPEDKCMSEAERMKFDEQRREFDENLAFLKDKHKEDSRLKEKQIDKKTVSSK